MKMEMSRTTLCTKKILKVFDKEQIIGMLFIICDFDLNLFFCINIDQLIYVLFCTAGKSLPKIQDLQGTR